MIKNLTVFLHSIRFRLVMWFTIILTLVMFSFSLFIYYNQTRDIRGDTVNRLQTKLVDIEAAMEGNLHDSRVLQPSDIFILFDSTGKVILNQGVKSSQDVISLVNHAQTANKPNPGQAESVVASWLQDWNNAPFQYIFIVNQINISGQSGFAILGSPYDPYGLNSRLLFTLSLGSLITIIIAMSGGLWLADRAMRPVHAITQAARMISETDLNHRLNIEGRDELAELAGTFDGMLARLQMAFERQRQFVADASHELRTPLTIVNLEASRVLSGKRTTQDYLNALGVIQSENDFMSHLVNQLLTLAHMDAGQLEIQMQPIDLGDVALDAVERLAPLAQKNNIRLEAGELPETQIEGDRQYLLQMASNLIENAIKYTRRSDGLIKVETGQDEEFAWIKVMDNGIGIEKEHLAHLFDRFYRVDKARSREDEGAAGGSGLGLAIVDWIVKAHGGHIIVDSTPGAGTTFEVRFIRNSRFD